MIINYVDKQGLEDFTRRLLENDKRIEDTIKMVTPQMFGAKGDGITDDTEAFQNAIDVAYQKNKIVSLSGLKFAVSTLEIKDVCIRDGSIEIIDGNIILSGKSALEKVSIHRKDNNLVWNGDVQLQNTNGCIIKDCSFDTLSRGFGIFCYTKAINTHIENCTFNTGWGILFDDDAVNHNFVKSRNYNGIDYTNESIGHGLYISNCKFKTVNSDFDGDNVEINTPNHRFRTIICNDNTSYGSKSINNNGANGIGFGFANVDNVICNNNNVENSEGSGGIHFEKSTNIECKNNNIINSKYGIMSIHNDVSGICGNNIIDCYNGIWMLDGENYSCNYIQCSNNNLINIKKYNIVSGTINYSVISKNIIKTDTDVTNTGIINIENGSSFNRISDNVINYTGTKENIIPIKIDGSNNVLGPNVLCNVNPSNIFCDSTKNTIK